MENLIDLAFENELNLYQYPVTKAYEVTSCFEGLIEFYKITGEEKYLEGAIEGAKKGLFNAITGGLTVGAMGITAAIVFGYIFAVLFKSKSKTN